MTWSDSPRAKWLFMLAGVVFLLGALLLVNQFESKFSAETTVAVLSGDEGLIEVGDIAKNERHNMPASDKGDWTVYVTGGVKRPGVYVIPPNTRVHHAIDAAGGFSSFADPQALNLAERIEDGVHIKVPLRGSGNAEKEVVGRQTSVTQTGGSQIKAQQVPLRVNINTADAQALQNLPGIGPKTAENIVADRESNGLFGEVDDLMRVTGIGPKKMERLREHVRVE